MDTRQILVPWTYQVVQFMSMAGCHGETNPWQCKPNRGDTMSDVDWRFGKI